MAVLVSELKEWIDDLAGDPTNENMAVGVGDGGLCLVAYAAVEKHLVGGACPEEGEHRSSYYELGGIPEEDVAKFKIEA